MRVKHEDFRDFDFKKAKRCVTNPHSSFIGFWAHWWLKLTEDRGRIIDGGRKFPRSERHIKWKDDYYKNKKSNSINPDLNLFDENCKEVGVVEVENDTIKYIARAEGIFEHLKSKDLPNLKFGILMTYQYTETGAKRKDSVNKIKNSKKTIKDVKKYIRNRAKGLSDDKIFVLVNLLWDHGKHILPKDVKKGSYRGEEIIIYSNRNDGKIIKKFKISCLS